MRILLPWIAAAAVSLAAAGCTGDGQDSRSRIPQVLQGEATSADGVPIHYMVTGALEPALVFVHGWNGDGSYWHEQMRALGREHIVVALDLAGHGRGPCRLERGGFI